MCFFSVSLTAPKERRNDSVSEISAGISATVKPRTALAARLSVCRLCGTPAGTVIDFFAPIKSYLESLEPFLKKGSKRSARQSLAYTRRGTGRAPCLPPGCEAEPRIHPASPCRCPFSFTLEAFLRTAASESKNAASL